MDLAPDLERPRRPGPESDWAEIHRLDVHVSGDGLSLSLQIGVQPNRNRASFLAAVLEPGRSPIVISDLDVPPPGRGWEVRTSGLWADHVCESPLEHWSYGLEAFALAIDDPRELLGRGFGHRVALGWELEFEAQGPPESVGESSKLAGYGQRGIGHGLLLSAGGERPVEGRAVRSHWWGTESWSAVSIGTVGEIEPLVVLPGEGRHWTYRSDTAGLSVRPVGS